MQYRIQYLDDSATLIRELFAELEAPQARSSLSPA